MIRLELPLPPSSNELFLNPRGGRGRRPLAPRYRAWRLEAGWIVKAARLPKITGPYTFELLVPAKMRGDASNRIKAPEDLFVKLGVTPDDRFCQRAAAERSPDVAPGRCVVIIKQA